MAKSEQDLKAILIEGTEAFRARNYEKAARLLEEFAEERSSFADVYNMLGQSYHNLGRLELAIKAYEKSLEINPRYTEVAINLAVTLFDIGRYDQASAVQERLQAEVETRQDHLDPYALKKLANMHSEIGDAYHALGLHDQAVEEYVKALHLAPQFPDVRTKLAESYRDKGMIDEAIHELEQLKEAQPNYIPARMALGLSYYAKCRIDDAVSEWKYIIDIDQGNKAASAYLRLVQKDTSC